MPGTLRRWGEPCLQASDLHSARGRTDSPAFGELPLVPVDLVDTSVFECPLLNEPGWELQTNPKSCLTQSCQVDQCRSSILPAAWASVTLGEGTWKPLLGAPSAWAMSHWGKTLVLPWSACVCVCVCVCVHARVCVCTCMCVHVCMCMCARVSVCSCVCVCVHACVCVCLGEEPVCVCVCVLGRNREGEWPWR